MIQSELRAPRLHNIEFLRILFTFCIFCCHFLDAFKVTNEGRFSVEFFFILSGFFLYYTIDNQKNVQTFVLKKVIRFLPLMLFGQVVCDLISLKFRFQNYISLAFFLPSTGLTDFNYFSVGAAWYVCALFWILLFYFYLVKTKMQSTADIVIGIITFICCVAYNKIPHNMMRALFPHYMLRGLICIGIGYFLALICKKNNLFSSPHTTTNEKQGREQCVKWIFSGLELWLMLYLLLTMFIPWEFKIAYTHRVILFAILIALFIAKKGLISQFFEDNSWAKISKYCLSFFLTHLVIKDYLYRKIDAFNNVNINIAFCIMFFLSVLLAVFAYHFVEQPAYKYLKRFLDK